MIHSSSVPLEDIEPAYLTLVFLLGLAFTLTVRHQRSKGFGGTGLLVSAWALLLRATGLTSLAIPVFLLTRWNPGGREYLIDALIQCEPGCCGRWQLAQYVSILHLGMICLPLGLLFCRLSRVIQQSGENPQPVDPDWRLVHTIAEWLWCLSVFAFTYLTWSWAGVPRYLDPDFESRFHDVLGGSVGVVLLTGLVCVVQRPGPLRKWVLGLGSLGFLALIGVWACRGHHIHASDHALLLIGIWAVFLLVRGWVLTTGGAPHDRILSLGHTLLRYGFVSSALLTVPFHITGMILFYGQSVPDDFLHRHQSASIDFTAWSVALSDLAWLVHHGLIILVAGGLLVLYGRSQTPSPAKRIRRFRYATKKI